MKTNSCVVFISEQPFFDCSINIASCLFRKYQNMHFIVDCRVDESCFLPLNKLNGNVSCAVDYPELNYLGYLINLSRTILLKSYTYYKPIRTFKRMWHCYHQTRRLKPDVVVTDSISFQTILTLLCFYSRSVLLIHDPFLHGNENFLHVRMLRAIAFCLVKKKVLFNQSQYNAFIEAHSYSTLDVKVAFLSIYGLYTAYQRRVKSESSTTKILFFGRITRYKGIEYLLESLLYLAKEHGVRYDVTLAGRGDYYFDVAPYESLHPHIINTFLSDQELADLIQSSSFVVCPYTEATQSGVVMTAFALCKPVLATMVGGLPEMIEDGVTGRLVEPCNMHQMAKAIQEMSHSEVLAQYSENIRKIYHEGSRSWQTSVGIIAESINEAGNRR